MFSKKINDLIALVEKNFKFKLPKNQSKDYFLVVDRSRYLPTLTLSLLSSNIIYKKRLKPILISDLKPNHPISKIFKAFGVNTIYSSFNKFLFFNNIFLSVSCLVFTLLGLIQIKIRSFKWFIENFRVHNILVGDLVFDSYVRNYNHYQNPKTDTRFLIILFQAIFRTKRITKLFNERNIKFTLIPTSAYVSNGAIAARVALENKIRVIEPYLYGSREITKQTVKNGYHYEKVKKNFKNIQKVKNKSANKFFDDRFNRFKIGVYTGKKDFLFQNKKKLKYTLNDKQLIKYGIDREQYKKIILFACHAFSDAPHSLGNKFIFTDYYDHLLQTLNFIKKNKNDDVLWLVKKHPSSEYYGENGVVEKVIKKINYKNIKLFPEKINTINAIKFCDAVFTGRGTIGMEFACYGKLAITAGEAPYSYMKFNKVFHNKDSYFKYIKKISNIKTINPSQSIIARKTLFFLEMENRNFLNKSKILDQDVHKKFYSLNPKIRRKDEYVINKKLFDNLKKYNILNDSYSDNFIKFHKI